MHECVARNHHQLLNLQLQVDVHVEELAQLVARDEGHLIVQALTGRCDQEVRSPEFCYRRLKFYFLDSFSSELCHWYIPQTTALVNVDFGVVHHHDPVERYLRLVPQVGKHAELIICANGFLKRHFLVPPRVKHAGGMATLHLFIRDSATAI